MNTLKSLSGGGKVLYADSSIGEGMDITIQGEPAQQVGMNFTNQAVGANRHRLCWFRLFLENGNGCQINSKTHL